MVELGVGPGTVVTSSVCILWEKLCMEGLEWRKLNN